MRNNNFTFSLLIMLLVMVSCKPVVNNIYCIQSPTNNQPQTNEQRKTVPQKLNEDSSVLYYKLDNHIDFQTLVFNSDEEHAYTVIGRFNGKKLSEDLYKIDSIELVAYDLKEKKRTKYEVVNVEIGQIKPKFVELKIELVTNITETRNDNNVDFTFKPSKQHFPFIINKNQTLTFSVYDVNKGVLGGGYECNGRPSFPTGP